MGSIFRMPSDVMPLSRRRGGATLKQGGRQMGSMFKTGCKALKSRAAKGLSFMIACCLGASLLMSGCRNKEQERRELRIQGIEQLKAENYEEAIQSFEQALQNNSSGFVGEFELDILKYRAEAEYRAGDYDAAAYTYEILLQVDEENEEYLTRMCMLAISGGQLDKAKEGYQKLYETKPQPSETPRILLSLGQALTEADRFDEAQELYEQAMNGGIQSGEIYNRMGLCKLEAGEIDEAIRYFEQGLLIGDESASALMLNQAAAYERKLDFARALEILRQYGAAFGVTPEVEKEIDFLKSR